MDADSTENQRDQLLSRRKKRWSMNSQRLEEIVAELMRPISGSDQFFDTDISSLLEDYLTEAGLHALDADDGADGVAPNYAELALLLQQTVFIYGRKVDFLYQHVINVNEALHINAPHNDAAQATAAEDAGVADEPAGEAVGAVGEPAGPAGAARARSSRAPPRVLEFVRTGSQRGAQRAVRGPGTPRPHPTLPRVFMELEPRIMGESRYALRDYAGEIIGLLDDFHATVELSHSRMLVVDEFEAPEVDEQSTLRPISLVELQQAIEAAAPPLLELASPRGSPSSPLRTSTPLAHALDASELDAAAAMDSTVELVVAPPVRRQRKRRRSVINIGDIAAGCLRIIINVELRRHLVEIREFSIPITWIKRVVKKRSRDILSERGRLRELEPDPHAAFPGWSAAAAATQGVGPDSDDDDGFFEQSSEVSGVSPRDSSAAWRAGVLERAAAAQARGGLDVRAVAGRVLRALPDQAPLPFDDVLRSTAREHAEVSHVLLSTLFLVSGLSERESRFCAVVHRRLTVLRLQASAGNVRVLPGAPLSLNSFSLQLLSTDERLYGAAADAAAADSADAADADADERLQHGD